MRNLFNLQQGGIAQRKKQTHKDGKLLNQLNKKIEVCKHKKTHSAKVLKPDIDKTIVDCVENWNELEEYAKWEAAVKQIWERVVEGKEAIKFAEYEKVLSFIHGVVSTGNAARASQVGYMTREDFF